MVFGKGGKAMGVAAALAATPLLVPGALGMAGFGPEGIAGGSWAAALMRSYGGKVPADSLCAMLQRLGVHGLHTSTIVITEGVAAALTGMSVIFFKRADPKAAPATAPAHLQIEDVEAPLLIEPAEVEEWAPFLAAPDAAPAHLQIEDVEAPLLIEPAEVEEWAPFLAAESVVEEPDSPSTEKRADDEEEASSSSAKEPPFTNNPFAEEPPSQPYVLLNPFAIEERPSMQTPDSSARLSDTTCTGMA